MQLSKRKFSVTARVMFGIDVFWSNHDPTRRQKVHTGHGKFNIKNY